MKFANAIAMAGFIVGFALSSSASMLGQAQGNSDEVLIGPITIPADYAGIDLSVPARAFVRVASTPTGLDIGVRIQGDLGNLQGRVGQIIDSFPLPKNNCASYGVSNAVVNVWGKQLQSSGQSAILMLHGYVEIWGCASNPIPNSKVEWRKDGPFHLSIPHIVTWPGDPIKTIVAKQPFDVSLPISLVVVDDHTARFGQELPPLR